MDRLEQVSMARQLLGRNRIKKPAVAKVVSEWFHGDEVKDVLSVYTNEEDDTVVTIVLFGNRLHFIRCFLIGDTWSLSVDEELSLGFLESLPGIPVG